MPAPPCHSTVVVLLAAGAGRRFAGDGHKLSAILPATAHHGAQTVLERSLTHALDAGIGPIVVVTGAADIGRADGASGSAPDAGSGLLRPEVTVCHNDRWADGQITSLHAGIEAARALGATNVVVGLADQPGIGADAWRTVAATDGPIVVATYEGRRANPVKLDQTVWPLLPTSGDEGARALMRVRPELIREVPCSGHPTDIDTTEDLRRWQNN